MKKIISLLLVLAALLCASACDGENDKKDNPTEEESVSEASSAEETTEEESINISYDYNVVYKDEYFEGGYYIEDGYNASGVLLYSASKTENGLLYEKKVFDGEGKLLKHFMYNDEGDLDAYIEYAYENAAKVVWTLYNADGTFVEKNVSEYINNKISSITAYDEDNVCFSEQLYTYNNDLKLEKYTTNYFENDITVFNSISIYNPDSGKLLEETETYYDGEGRMLYKDVYGIKDGKYGFIGRYNSNGDEIPVEDAE